MSMRLCAGFSRTIYEILGNVVARVTRMSSSGRGG